MTSERTVAERLAARLGRAPGDADRARAVLHLVDWVGTALAGARSPVDAAMSMAVPGDDLLSRSLRWGALGNVLEMDDVEKRALLHPGPVVIPAALALAAELKSDGVSLLDSIVRGYEAMIRVGRAVGPDHYRYWHNTSTCGPFGAAAAAASLMDLDEGQVANALGLAGTQAAGPWQVRHEPASHAKQLHTARAAHAGLLAARLVQGGFVGLRTIFEGPQGFFAAMCGDADPGAVAAGDGWAIHDVSFKPWPACRHAHPAIDAALILREPPIGEADQVTVRTYADAIRFCDRTHPADTLSARFSLQHAVAITLLRGPPTLADFEPRALNDPMTAALRNRISVVEDETITLRYPAHFGASIEVRGSGGVRRAHIADALGDPENPMEPEAVFAKARRLMSHAGLGDAEAEGLVRAVGALERNGDVGDLVARLEKGLRP